MQSISSQVSSIGTTPILDQTRQQGSTATSNNSAGLMASLNAEEKTIDCGLTQVSSGYKGMLPVSTLKNMIGYQTMLVQTSHPI